MTAIFLPVGIGIVIGVMLYVLAFSVLICVFVAGIVLVPIFTILSHYTPKGRVRFAAKRRAFHELCAAPRGTPERRAALARYKSI
ncbi:MAG: hypothetical protein ACREQX_19090 [Candidatus Binataceae bacterium]